MIKTHVTEIGDKALSKDEDIIILFGEDATTELKNHSVIQEVPKNTTFTLEVGDTIKFDDEKFIITKVGKYANDHLSEIGHVSLFFRDVEGPDDFPNALFLRPHYVPKIKKGTVITYQ